MAGDLDNARAAEDAGVADPAAPAEEVRDIYVDEISTNVLRLELRALGNTIAKATGFVVRHDGGDFLVSNWHVLSGRNADTDQPLDRNAAIPDTVRIHHHSVTALGQWVQRDEPLVDNAGGPFYIEHSDGRQIDIAALRLTQLNDVHLYPFNLALADGDIVPTVAMPVSIVGFPLGIAAAEGFPIWKTGHIATDFDLDYDGRPAFLIDATTRNGMSGGPVILRMSGGFRTRSGNLMLAGANATRFLGIYSGRLDEVAEIGRVWRPQLIAEVLGRHRAPGAAGQVVAADGGG